MRDGLCEPIVRGGLQVSVEAFLLVEIDRATVALRRYRSTRYTPDHQPIHEPCPKMPGEYSYHDASMDLGTFPLMPVTPTDDEPWRDRVLVIEGLTIDSKGDHWSHDDYRWPARCACGYVFVDDDKWQVSWHPLWKRADGAAGEWSLRDAPPGAIWNATWMGDFARGKDGRCLVAKLPNGHDWMIDGPASNCTMQGEKTHRCWIRHGEPPKLTVDKNAGTEDASAPTTCAAGAGSIASGDYHGFLQGGVFT